MIRSVLAYRRRELARRRRTRLAGYLCTACRKRFRVNQFNKGVRHVAGCDAATFAGARTRRRNESEDSIPHNERRNS